jgi:hypothetical protein
VATYFEENEPRGEFVIVVEGYTPVKVKKSKKYRGDEDEDDENE